MLTLEQCRQAHPDLAHMSDNEILELRDACYRMAELAYSHWKRESRAGSNASPEVACKPEQDKSTLNL